MISKKLKGKKYCKFEDVQKIENYSEAINDKDNIWHCHHRLETHNSDGEKRLVQLTPEELKALDMYYNRPPEELIFLTREMHVSVHKSGVPISDTQKSFISLRTKEAMNNEIIRNKISTAHKGKPSWNKGVPMTDSAKNHLAQLNRIYPLVECIETNEKHYLGEWKRLGFTGIHLAVKTRGRCHGYHFQFVEEEQA
jgi:hypothetical protein